MKPKYPFDYVWSHWREEKEPVSRIAHAYFEFDTPNNEVRYWVVEEQDLPIVNGQVIIACRKRLLDSGPLTSPFGDIS